jgi:NAD(P)H-hydrate epimerase
MNGPKALITAAASQAMDAEAVSQWFFDGFALVEAAGRRAAQVLTAAYPRLFGDSPPFTLVLAGPGNNGADAMVILRSLVLSGEMSPEKALLYMTKAPGDGDRNPRSELYRSLKKMGIPVLAPSAPAGGEPRKSGAPLESAPLEKVQLIIDGIAGTGLKGELREDAALLVGE